MNHLSVMGAGVLVFSADMASKAWALASLDSALAFEVAPFLSFRLAYNSGIAFSLFASEGAGTGPYIIAVTVLLVIAIAWMAATTANGSERLGFAFILGGAVGNLTDRVKDGLITDFIDVHWAGWHFPTFNVADIAITSGVTLLLAWMPIAARQKVHRGP